ncbi:Lpg1974 family pore-forming outer membrane protein [Legionella quinlivanii]|uniref:Lpg1974 family pore-forming outer membrane protein n=1 Tax=Legionella quinlivanii TaxID=45073 RepID=UPI0022440EDF|nr:Lpg1974 family pore-forming outer membrane protein [Legionella quinlivanii]MCW8449785.1 Lpg1974 family pore-forming outer membrane protein [Legionella quinlivanii]
MMYTKKYLPLLLASIYASGSAFAGTMGEVGCTSVLCAVDAPGGFYLGGTAYYVKPSETGIGMVTDSWLFTSPGGFTARSKPFNPPHRWAGNVKLGYDFPMSANNIEANYLFLENKTHATNDFSNGSIGFGSILFPDATVPPSFGFVSDAQLKYEVDQVDLKVGRKYTDVNHNFSIRPSVGVRYAELKHSLTFAAPGNMISKYDGAGPMVSIEGNYMLAYGVGLVGYFDYGLLAGQSQTNSYVSLAGTNFGFSWPKQDRVVSSITARVGANYSYAFSNAANLTLEAGYQVNEFLNAMDTIRGTIAFDGIQRINGLETNDFGFRGPYISLTVHA